MEKQEIRQVKNLLELISKQAPWELDPQLKKILLELINLEKFTMLDNGDLCYNNVLVTTLRALEDEYRWENRHLQDDFSISAISKYYWTLLLTAIKNKSVALPDKIIVVCGSIIIIDEAIENVKDRGGKYTTTLTPFATADDKTIEQLTPETKRMIKFYQLAVKKEKSRDGK